MESLSQKDNQPKKMIEEDEILSVEDLIKGQHIAYLIDHYLKEQLSSMEKQELDSWIVESEHNLRLFEELTSEGNLIKKAKELRRINTAESLERVKRRIGFTKFSLKTEIKDFFNKFRSCFFGFTRNNKNIDVNLWTKLRISFLS
jgi:hypothetical protein